MQNPEANIQVIQKPPALNMPSLQLYKSRMMCEIAEFDETDFKTLLCHTARRMSDYPAKKIDTIIPALIARIGVIMGIHIPSDENVFKLLCTELSNTILKEKYFAQLTYADYVHAFNMAANGDFGELKDFGKALNIKYFKDVMNPYLRYKSALLHKYHDWEMIAAEKMELKKTEENGIDHRAGIERIYQDYLSDKYNAWTWPEMYYDALVKLELIPEKTWQRFITKAKQLLVAEINADIMRFEKNRIKLDGNIYNSRDNLPILIGQHLNSVNELSDIRNNSSELRVQIRAKQICLVEYFKQQAIEGVEHIFTEAKPESK